MFSGHDLPLKGEEFFPQFRGQAPAVRIIDLNTDHKGTSQALEFLVPRAQQAFLLQSHRYSVSTLTQHFYRQCTEHGDLIELSFYGIYSTVKLWLAPRGEELPQPAYAKGIICIPAVDPGATFGWGTPYTEENRPLGTPSDTSYTNSPFVIIPAGTDASAGKLVKETTLHVGTPADYTSPEAHGISGSFSSSGGDRVSWNATGTGFDGGAIIFRNGIGVFEILGGTNERLRVLHAAALEGIMYAILVADSGDDRIIRIYTGFQGEDLGQAPIVDPDSYKVNEFTVADPGFSSVCVRPDGLRIVFLCSNKIVRFEVEEPGDLDSVVSISWTIEDNDVVVEEGELEGDVTVIVSGNDTFFEIPEVEWWSYVAVGWNASGGEVLIKEVRKYRAFTNQVDNSSVGSTPFGDWTRYISSIDIFTEVYLSYESHLDWDSAPAGGVLYKKHNINQRITTAGSQVSWEDVFGKTGVELASVGGPLYFHEEKIDSDLIWAAAGEVMEFNILHHATEYNGTVATTRGEVYPHPTGIKPPGSPADQIGNEISFGADLTGVVENVDTYLRRDVKFNVSVSVLGDEEIGSSHVQKPADYETDYTESVSVPPTSSGSDGWNYYLALRFGGPFFAWWTTAGYVIWGDPGTDFTEYKFAEPGDVHTVIDPRFVVGEYKVPITPIRTFVPLRVNEVAAARPLYTRLKAVGVYLPSAIYFDDPLPHWGAISANPTTINGVPVVWGDIDYTDFSAPKTEIFGAFCSALFPPTFKEYLLLDIFPDNQAYTWSLSLV